MGLLTKALAAPFRLWNALSDEILKERRLALKDGASWSAFFGTQSAAGKNVTMEKAMQLATVWACIKTTSDAAASLPLGIFDRLGDNSRVEVDDDIAQVLTESPNEDQTPLEFWESQISWLLTRGNSYSEIITVGKKLRALQPIPSTKIRPRRNTSGELIYVITIAGKTEEMPRDKIFHLKGFGQALPDIDLGLSPMNVGANTFGSAMAADETAGKMFANGLAASGALSSERILKDPQRVQLQTMLEAYQGSERAGKTIILEAGLKYEQMMLNPDDAQLLDTRRFDVEEICRWFGMPPIVIGHSAQGQTMWGSGVEQVFLMWKVRGIDPLCGRIEARINKQLIRPTGKRKRFAHFDREALLQMDSKAKAEFLSTMVQNGIMDRNEARTDRLNLPSREGADQLTAQVNMAPLDKLGQVENRSSQ